MIRTTKAKVIHSVSFFSSLHFVVAAVVCPRILIETSYWLTKWRTTVLNQLKDEGNTREEKRKEKSKLSQCIKFHLLAFSLFHVISPLPPKKAFKTHKLTLTYTMSIHLVTYTYFYHFVYFRKACVCHLL